MRRSCRSRPRIAGGLLDLLRLDGRDREVASLAGGADEPGHADAVRLRPAALVLVRPGRRRAGGDARRARRAPRAHLGDRSRPRPRRACGGCRSSSAVEHRAAAARARRAPRRAARAASISSSSRFSTLRWCFRSCSTSACIACSSRGELISPEYILASTSVAFAPSERASSSSGSARRAPARRAPRASRRQTGVERRGVGLRRGRARLALGKRLGDGGAAGRARRRAPGARGASRAPRVTGRPGTPSTVGRRALRGGGRGRRGAGGRLLLDASGAAGAGVGDRCAPAAPTAGRVDVTGRGGRTPGPGRAAGWSGWPASAWLMNAWKIGAAETPPKPAPPALFW